MTLSEMPLTDRSRRISRRQQCKRLAISPSLKVMPFLEGIKLHNNLRPNFPPRKCTCTEKWNETEEMEITYKGERRATECLSTRHSKMKTFYVWL